MSNIINALDRTYKYAIHKKWDTLYWAIDLHGTILYANYKDDSIERQFYPLAKETLQLLTERTDTRLIMFTSTTKDKIQEYTKMFNDNNIFFDYVNCNPEVEATKYASFKDKFYFNVMLEDKAGFEPEEDWADIYDFISEQRLLKI